MILSYIISLVLLASLAGCIDITTELQVNDAVKPTLRGQDCVGIFLGWGIGTIRMKETMRSYTYAPGPAGASMVPASTKTEGPRIRRVHSIALTDESMFGFGQRCLEVTGEE